MAEDQKQKTLGIAIASLVCGCLFLVPLLGMLSSLVAVILGIIALVYISGNKETLKGKGMAIAGIVLGSIGLILVPIVFLLGALIVPRLSGGSEQARASAAHVDILTNIGTALKLYELDNGVFPATDEGLDALISRPGSAPNWSGPYLVRKPVDPWGREYIYSCPGNNNKEYDLYSLGPDGVESADDVTNRQ
ncbi:MAG: type II secretion system major pseudopilin GspG [Methanosarcinaceae archaeon]|nr:type II secretion system major pseudopilin GspG [Methanosarcinaceae archaeon]